MIFEKIRETFRNIHRVVECDEDLEWNRAVYKCTTIVDEVEAEYNNGWIPCSERLPNEADYYLVTKEDDIAYSIDIALWDDYHWSNNGFHKADKVIAWQPLPQPPKGE